MATPGAIFGRYELQAPLGSGATARVHRGRDRVTGEPVAIKVCHGGAVPIDRLRREVAALRALRVPGVVRLRDAGPLPDGWAIVTDLAVGTDFPGPGPRDPERLLSVARRLAAVLASIHRAGFVHRDLKPANVLVSDDGVPTVLDLGLAVGPRLASDERDGWMTPAYAAPEQWLGGAVTAAADVYAFGAMVAEAASGLLPYEPSDLGSRFRPRISDEIPAPLRSAVAAALAADAGMRPAHGDALAALLGAPVSRDLPFVGPHLEETLGALQARGQVRVGGATGTGKTRLLAEIARRLPTRRVARGVAPFSSLGIGSPRAEDLEEVRRHVETLLTEDPSVVWVADDFPAVDRWSAAALADLASRGRVRLITTANDSGNADLVLRPLPADVLAAWFAGSERLRPVRRRAAEALWARTGGHPAAASAEVEAWVRAGIATVEGGILVSHAGYEALEWLPPSRPGRPVPADLAPVATWVGIADGVADPTRLAGWTGMSAWEVEAALEALIAGGHVRLAGPSVVPVDVPVPELESRRSAMHAAVADALPQGDPARLRHLLIAGRPDAFAEGCARARRALDAGNVDRAVAVLEEIRSTGDPNDRDYGRLWLECGLKSDSRSGLERAALYVSPEDPELTALAEAALAPWEGMPERASQLTDDLPESWFKAAVRVDAALRSDLGDAAREIARAAEVLGEPATALWRGHLEYRTRRFADAVRSYLSAAEHDPRPGPRASALSAAAASSIEIGAFEQARDLASRSRELSREADNAVGLARAEVLERVALYRSGAVGPPDVALVDALDEAGFFRLTALCALTEAARAWRYGHLDEARRLAGRAARGFDVQGNPEGARLARALGWACGGERPGPAESPRPRSSLALQADALLGLEPPSRDELAVLHPEALHLDVLSMQELNP